MKLPRLSWAKIEEEFNARFSKIFMARNAKAHFDFLTEIVDGAKERWRSLQLLDAVLCAVYCCRPLDYRSVRRNFEHHDAFQEAVMKAMEIAIEESLSQEKGENESVTNEGLEEKEAANIPAQADDEKEADDLDIARATTIVETTNENEKQSATQDMNSENADRNGTDLVEGISMTLDIGNNTTKNVSIDTSQQKGVNHTTSPSVDSEEHAIVAELEKDGTSLGKDEEKGKEQGKEKEDDDDEIGRKRKRDNAMESESTQEDNKDDDPFTFLLEHGADLEDTVISRELVGDSFKEVIELRDMMTKEKQKAAQDGRAIAMSAKGGRGHSRDNTNSVSDRHTKLRSIDPSLGNRNISLSQNHALYPRVPPQQDALAKMKTKLVMKQKGIDTQYLNPDLSAKGGSLTIGCLTDIYSPWDDIEALRGHFLRESMAPPPSEHKTKGKAYAKRQELIETLTTAEAFRTDSLAEVLVRSVECTLRRVATACGHLKDTTLRINGRFKFLQPTRQNPLSMKLGP